MAEDSRWDVFISYASEDGDAIAYPLARLLQLIGTSVWIDRTELKVGDSLRSKLDDGLARSRYGVAVLSPAFFAKHWPNHELNGLAQRESDGRKVILPLWHGVTVEDVRRYSPPLADRVAISTTEPLERVAFKLLEVLRPDLVEAARQSAARIEELPKLSTGADAVAVIAGPHMFSHHNEEVTTPEEAELIGDAMQRLQEISEAWDDLEISDRVRFEYEIGEEIKQLASRGWELFGRQERRNFVFSGKNVVMNVAFIVAARGPGARAMMIDGKVVVGHGRDDEPAG